MEFATAGRGISCRVLLWVARPAGGVTALSPRVPLAAGTDLPVCASCGQGIYDGQYLQALKADWHADCFRCCECGASLSHQYYEKDGRLYCKKDYWARFGELCHGCSEQITKGLVMVSTTGSLGSVGWSW
ncbi:PREDICTED: LIM domain kinase 1 [Corvus brachyrhynchos]|uniref:LIM domain kinase 1 n=1 Tax=Corvus brachyrhynchos TaxID=85066 RepID=UPI000816409A|nr:PREDICTED: LIM domain kinase 1 [Corvus brachyrhynchos]